MLQKKNKKKNNEKAAKQTTTQTQIFETIQNKLVLFFFGPSWRRPGAAWIMVEDNRRQQVKNKQTDHFQTTKSNKPIKAMDDTQTASEKALSSVVPESNHLSAQE
jgi:hypothetical protein